MKALKPKMRRVRREDQTEEHRELSTTDRHAPISEEVRTRWQKQSEIRRQGQERLHAYISEGLRKMEEQEVEDKRASQAMVLAEQNEMDMSLEERKRQGRKELKEFVREVNKLLGGVSDQEESEPGDVSVSDTYTTESVWEIELRAKKTRSGQEMDRLKQDKRQCDVERERELERKRELKRLQRAKREQQVVEERGGQQQMNIKAKQKAERQREMATQQEQELSHDIEKLMQIIQEVSETDKGLHEMVKDTLQFNLYTHCTLDA